MRHEQSASHANTPAGMIRQLRPSELPLFRNHLLRLDAASRRDRFNGITDDQFVASLRQPLLFTTARP